MKKIIFILVILSGIIDRLETAAQNVKEIAPGVSIENIDLKREGKYLALDMILDLNRLDVETNRAVLLTPRLINGSDSTDLPSVGIYGRRRYYYYVRNGIGSISGESETVFRASNKPDSVTYENLTEYKEWMDGALLEIHRSDWGCCHQIVAEYEDTIGHHHESFFPEIVFVQPKAEILKIWSLSGSAYIDFPVDQTVIYPDYRRNKVELSKIQAIIDSVRNDRDITITSVWLKGYASPESSYQHNTELAIGRTAALKKHIGELYNFADSLIRTDYEPEDWAGLRRCVEQSNIGHRAEILALIDGDMQPDDKEATIKRLYPDAYRFMLQNIYPALRHTDYRIDYRIRTFSEADEIEHIMAEQPQKLSLNEFYLVAGKYEPGTEEFTNVFQTAVHMYPNDETANLNAANAAIRRDDFSTAHRCLDKAGDSAEAVYARGALAVREGDYDTARRFLVRAKEMGLDQAGKTLAELDKRLK